MPAIPPSAACGTGANRLGPPTAEEIKMVDAQLRAAPYVPAGTNHGNNFAYGTAGKHIGDMRTMYGLTGDLYYLDQAVKFADYFLTTRNDPNTGRVLWTGKREPCWPNNDDTAPDAGVCGAETAQVAGQILNVAKIIVGKKELWDKPVGLGDPSGYGATYIKRARTYLQECERSMDYFLAHFFDPAKDNFIVTPTDPAYAALGPNYAKAQGRRMAWNQEDMISDALALISDILIALGEDPARVASNDKLVKATLDHFVAELKTNQYMLGETTVYKWGYNPGDLQHVEDLAHASGDINMLNKGYRRGRYGIGRDVMVPMANTFFELVAKPDGTYAAHVDGKGSRPIISNSWTNYEEFRPGIVARLLPKLTIDASMPPNEAISILSTRKRFCPSRVPSSRRHLGECERPRRRNHAVETESSRFGFPGAVRLRRTHRGVVFRRDRAGPAQRARHGRRRRQRRRRRWWEWAARRWRRPDGAGGSSAGGEAGSADAGSSMRADAMTSAPDAGGPPPVVGGQFRHPGILVNRAQLDFIRDKVRAGAQPWKTAYDRAMGAYGSLSRAASPHAVVECGPYSSPDIGCSEEIKDASAAYLLAIAWNVTGDDAYAKKSIEVMNAWARTLRAHTNHNAPLQSGWSGAIWPVAGELIRHTYPGWAPADVAAFSTMLKNVYLPVVIKGSAGNGNWELVMIEAALEIAVFLDDHATFDRAVAMWRKRVPAYMYLEADGDHPAPPPTGGKDTPDAIKAFWFNVGMYVDGVAQETCRDFGHVEYGLASAVAVAETAFQQGLDLYKEHAERLRAPLEFHADYTLGKAAPAWLCGGKPNTRLMPTFEIAANMKTFARGYLLQALKLDPDRMRLTDQGLVVN